MVNGETFFFISINTWQVKASLLIHSNFLLTSVEENLKRREKSYIFSLYLLLFIYYLFGIYLFARIPIPTIELIV